MLQLLAGRAGGVGYLLKDRVAEVRTSSTRCAGSRTARTALDPEVVSQLFSATRQTDALSGLTPREREVLGLMAEGRSNSAIAAKLFLSAGSVEKYVTSIFGKLGLPPSEGDNRRVLAVLRYLEIPSERCRLGPMYSTEIEVSTGAEAVVHDLTHEAEAFLRDADAADGLLHVWVPHATAGPGDPRDRRGQRRRPADRARRAAPPRRPVAAPAREPRPRP